MRSEFYRVYDLLYSEYPYEQDKRRLGRDFYDDEYHYLRIIRQAIEKAGDESARHGSMRVLRPDAKYFLLINFHQMIVRPIFDYNLNYVERQKREIDFFRNFEEAIRFDIDSLINMSFAESEQSEVSGHHVMNAININWRGLRTTKFEIWG